MGRFLSVVALALTAAGAHAAEFKDVPAPVVERIRSALDERLLDSVSARFRDVKYVESREEGWGGTVCGKVNAKNAMGAFAGYRTFLGYVGGKDRKDPVVIIIALDDGDADVGTSMCAEKFQYQ